MQEFRLLQWCHEATELIRYGPDRKAVEQELMDHLVDRRDALMQQGMDEKEATGKTLEAMGDAAQIAPPAGRCPQALLGIFPPGK